MRTDRAAAEFRRRSAERRHRATCLAERIGQLVTVARRAASGRGFIDRREVDRAGALGLYNGMIDAAFQAFAALATLPDEDARPAGPHDHRARPGPRGAGAGRRAARRGLHRRPVRPGEHGQLVQIIGTQRFLYAEAVADLPDADRAELPAAHRGRGVRPAPPRWRTS